MLPALFWHFLPWRLNVAMDGLKEGCNPGLRDELDALLERLRLKRDDVKRKINQFHSPIVQQLPDPNIDRHRPFSNSAKQISRIIKKPEKPVLDRHSDE